MRALESGRSLPRNVRLDQLSEEELIGFWADDLSPAAGHHAARIPVSGQVCAMLTLDIAGFTHPDRDEEARIYIHKAFYAILREALQGSGMPWDRCHHEDRGDGALVVAPPDIPAHGIIDPFPERLRGLIRVHNRMSIPAARIQVRAAAHIGPVYRDDHGLIGDDINLLFRMLDAEPLHAALAGSGAELALAISGYMHDSLVRRHPAQAGQILFRQVHTQVKGTQVDAWIHLPGVPAQLRRGHRGHQLRRGVLRVADDTASWCRGMTIITTSHQPGVPDGRSGQGSGVSQGLAGGAPVRNNGKLIDGKGLGVSPGLASASRRSECSLRPDRCSGRVP